MQTLQFIMGTLTMFFIINPSSEELATDTHFFTVLIIGSFISAIIAIATE